MRPTASEPVHRPTSRGSGARAVAATGLLLALVGSPDARAGSGGPDAAGYTWTDSVDGCPLDDEAWGPAVVEHLDVALTDVVGPVDLGFAMPFHGEFVTQAWLSPYGYLTFSPGQPSVPTPQVVPDPAGPNHLIAPHWTSEPIQQVNIRHEAGPDALHLEWEMFLGPAWIRANTDLWLFADGTYRILWGSANSRFPVLVGHEDRTGSAGNTLVYRTDGGVFPVRDGDFPSPGRGWSACIDVPEPPGTLDCTAAPDLPCGSSGHSSPAAVSPNVEYYGCGSDRWAGKEEVLRLELEDVSDVTITLGAAGRDMAVFLLEGCNEWRCLDGGDLDAVATALAPGTYFVVVEAATVLDEGAFSLTVACTALSDRLACEDALAGTTSVGASRFDAYPCRAGDYSGRETLTTLDFTPPGNIAASVDSATGLSAFILSGGGPLAPEQCLAGGVGGAIVYDPPAGRYTVVVDGPPGSEGPYTLSTTCEPQISCTGGALDCDGSRIDTTVGRLSLVDFYACSTLPYTGPEVVYELQVPTREVVSFALDDSADPRLDLFLLDECNEGACIAAGRDEISVELEPGTYRLVVDGLDGAAAPFELTTICGNTLQPDVVRVTAAEGECFTEHKTARLTPFIVQADVLFSIDLTGSMGGTATQLSMNMTDIVDRLGLFVRDLSFGLATFRDYQFNGTLTAPCPYTSAFGSTGDYPYRLEQPLTTDLATIVSAVQGMPSASGGSDSPESYARLLHEAAHDPAIGWRPGSRRILVNFGDELPHDCNVLACLGGVSTTDRGIDLGRDGLPETGDEIATLDAVADLVDAGIALLHFDTSGGATDGGFTYSDIWGCWAGLTGGRVERLERDGTVPSGIDLAQLISEVVREQGSYCSILELQASPGFEGWLVSSSPLYPGARLPGVFEFDIEICVPPGTPPGTYSFEVQALCSDGIAAVQQVVVEVVDECAPSVATPPQDQRTCLGDSVTLDAGGMTITNCSGSVDHQWRDGTAVVGSGPTLTVSPTQTTTYEVDVTCSTDPACFATESVTVTVDQPPTLATVTARDLAECNVGIEIAWDPAVFRGPGGVGVYNVYRSEVDCADALSRAPVAMGLLDTRWVDMRTRDGRTYHYVVEAEDAQAPSVCLPQGPVNGGAVARACVPPVTERVDPAMPEGVDATLRVAHAGASVTVDWSRARVLLPGEHFHLKKAHDRPTASFQLANGEGDRSRALTETDESSWLQFFDLRVANACEVESADEFPPDHVAP